MTKPITLYQYSAYKPWQLSSLSPFCMKLECYLKLANIPYTVKVLHDPRKAPKGKLPYIHDGNELIADSTLIINHLKQHIDLDDHLTVAQKALSTLLQRTVEDHLYWVLVYSRWLDSNNWPIVKPVYFSNLPTLLRRFIPEIIKKDVIKSLKYQGLGRHNKTDIYQLGLTSLQAIENYLPENGDFIFGKPSTIDATLYAFLASILYPPLSSPLKTYAEKSEKIKLYCDTIHKQYFSN